VSPQLGVWTTRGGHTEVGLLSPQERDMLLLAARVRRIRRLRRRPVIR
jgi:hypothetical protein